MKVLNVFLAIVAVLLFFILGTLVKIHASLEVMSQNPQAQSIVESNHAMIGEMQKLQNSFDSLRQEISDFRAKIQK
ncbi:MAG: hypothetical protein ACM3OC_10010 [Deltaproteobacteria bacterium]